MKAFAVLLSMLISIQVWARSWERIQIPGAYCGDGSQYSVFLDQRRKDKILIEFMGGGACWSESTCHGLDRKTWIYKIPAIPAFSYLTAESASHSWVDHTALYFPYCTGDVFSGRHVARYTEYSSRQTWHVGYTNILKSLNYLRERRILNFDGFGDVTLWGASAGAIGALVHSHNVAAAFPRATQKTLLADSPGLHFGDEFFDKFSSQMRSDFKQSFAAVGLIYPEHSGFVAPYFGPVFEQLQDWKVGVLQATKDVVMAVVFGELSPQEHERRVLSERGIIEVARPYSHVQVWAPRCLMHTFLLAPPTAGIENEENLSALRFAEQIYRSQK
ncbi:pectin acetylesterase-family hydrolase [Bdellovibrio bacteriovorus]|uniref:pectin acetylesterase-family hydrolase n=1 Tax=Bdellovibrio bacteriovorus TaxID=959 RepID=UPI0021D3C1B6|nr:pectin acetylesterase-family hydrolase [Bdellovibrio bacteriovorus]UXR65997.1 pectin acetylesterase-family hydrolase [Bdellovibrio bacteriovorus]